MVSACEENVREADAITYDVHGTISTVFACNAGKHWTLYKTFSASRNYPFLEIGVHTGNFLGSWILRQETLKHINRCIMNASIYVMRPFFSNHSKKSDNVFMYGARAPIDFLNLIDEFCCVALLTVKDKTANSFFRDHG